MIMFIVATAQSFAYTLPLQRVPHVLADLMLGFTAQYGTWMFMLLSIAILTVMGAILEGAAALIIFGPLLMPVAKQLGIDPLHYGIVLVVCMGIGLFAPPLGLGLYASCMIGGVRMEETIRPMMKYLGLIFFCVLLIAYFPWVSTALPRAMGY
jgi:TRAP-type C4-dicarboxylate transport system permease large subunit